MNKISEFIKYEFNGWKKPEIFGLLVVILVIAYNFFVLGDRIIAVISAVCGIMYTVIAGKGKISCYLFGLIGSSFYGYLSFINCLWGNLALYMLYYIPMQIIGVFKWKNNLKKTTKEIYKISLDKKQRFLVVLFSIVLCIISCSILYYTNDKNPLLDGIATALSLTGMYLTVRRAIEQWFFWGIVNLISATIWVKVAILGGKTISTALMWSVYFILSIYFYKEWKKELQS